MIKNIKQFLFVAGLLAIAAGAQPVGAAFFQWSTTPANNATADPNINWAEGMSPSSVNDSARAMMAAMAAWRIDNGGSLLTGGVSSAYTLTTNQPFASTSDLNGQSIAFVITPTNAAGATLNVNGIGAFPIVTENGAPITAAALHDGRIYHVTFSSANSVFRIHDVADNPFNVPLGGLLPSTAASVPNSSFVVPQGQCLSTVTYAAYWTLLGSPASGVCPGGQFQIIDLRGRTLVLLDTPFGGSAANRLTSSGNGCGAAMTAIGAFCNNGTESKTMTIAQMPAHFHAAGIFDPGHLHSVWQGSPGAQKPNSGGTAPFDTNVSVNSGSSVTGVRVNSSNGLDTTYSTGGGGAQPSVQPTVAVNYFLRVL